MNYKVKFTKSARKMLKKLSLDIQNRIKPKIKALSVEPRPDAVGLKI